MAWVRLLRQRPAECISSIYISFIKPETNDGLKSSEITEGEQLEKGETVGGGNDVGRGDTKIKRARKGRSAGMGWGGEEGR